MRTWIALAAKLYPRHWRDRYGPEFDALIEDTNPDWCELANVLGGAMKMQLKSGTYWKLAVAMAAAGALAALAVSLRLPERFMSSAMVQVHGESWIGVEGIQREVLSRSSLAELIQRPSLDLYRGERQWMPLEDVIDLMRRNVQIGRKADGRLSIAFIYLDRDVARRVVQELVTKFMETNLAIERNRQHVYQSAWNEHAPAGMVMEVLDPPAQARSLGAEARPALALAGAHLGAMLVLIWRWPRPAWKLAAFATAGCLLATAASYLIPNRYTSTVVMRLVPPIDARRWTASLPVEPFSNHVHRIAAQILSEDSLKELILRPRLNLYERERSRKPIAEVAREMRDQAVTVKEHAPSFEISFTYGDPRIAQAVVRELVTKAIEGNIEEQRNRARAEGGQYKLMVEYRIGELLEVLDPASLPMAPVAPNRTVIAGLGFVTGLLLGAVTLAIRRPHNPSIVRAVPAAAG